MGEYADMIIEGASCELCGGYICEKGPGYPQLCATCEREAEEEEFEDK